MPAGSAARSCTFCGLPEAEAKRLVAGQGVHICDRCIALATAVVQESAAKANERVTLALLSADVRCSFCGRKLRDTPGMAGTVSVRICGDCLALCVDVVEVWDRNTRGWRPAGPSRPDH